LDPATDQFGQLLFLFGAGRSGFGLQGLAIGREDGGINVIGLGALGRWPARNGGPGRGSRR
jgi:hypothetical protein